MNNKVIISVVSVVLLVGVVGFVNYKNKNVVDSTPEKLSAEMKAVSLICAPTEHKDICMESLKKAAPNGTTDPKELLEASLQTIIDALHASSNMSILSIPNATNSSMLRMLFEDCRDLYQYAIEDLRTAISFLADSDLHNMKDDRVYELRRWLSAVSSYQEICLDSIMDESEFKELIANNNLNADHLTGNALDIFAKLSEVLSSFGIKQNISSGTASRRLLEDSKAIIGHYYVPDWLSRGDRKLLGGQVAAVPNAVVAKDGSGHYKTISEALMAYTSMHRGGRYVIYVKAGTYEEYNIIDSNMQDVFMYGDGPTKTIITGDKNKGLGGIPISHSASFTVIGGRFLCKDMGFQNTAGPQGLQAPALYVLGDMAAFFNCRIDGYQDTLWAANNRQFYRSCTISGTIDFIFGDSSTVIQDSMIIVRKGLPGQQNAILAHGRERLTATTALVLQNCKIEPEQKLFLERFTVESYLGRPWKLYAATLVMESYIGDLINPAGYLHWNGDETGYFAEYGNRGPRANIDGRVRWRGFKGIIGRNEAMKFTPGSLFLQASTWLNYTQLPYTSGLTY